MSQFEQKLKELTETATRRSTRPEDFPGIFLYLLQQELFPKKTVETLGDFRNMTKDLGDDVSIKSVLGMLEIDANEAERKEDIRSITTGLKNVLERIENLGK